VEQDVWYFADDILGNHYGFKGFSDELAQRWPDVMTAAHGRPDVILNVLDEMIRGLERGKKYPSPMGYVLTVASQRAKVPPGPEKPDPPPQDPDDYLNENELRQAVPEWIEDGLSKDMEQDEIESQILAHVGRHGVDYWGSEAIARRVELAKTMIARYFAEPTTIAWSA
jgi:hypothetical protein